MVRLWEEVGKGGEGGGVALLPQSRDAVPRGRQALDRAALSSGHLLLPVPGRRRRHLLGNRGA